MMRSIYLKTLWEKRFFVLGWAIGLTALAALMTSFFPAMKVSGLDELVKNMPPAFKGLVGDLALLQSFDTYIASQLFDIRVPLITGIMAIILGLGVSISEEESGELRTLTALPVGRVSLLLQKWFAMLTIILVAACGLALGIYLVMPFIDDASIDTGVVVQLVAMTALMMTTYGTIPFAFAFATGQRAVATFVSIFVIIGGFILATFGSAVDWLKDYEKFSLLHYFPAVEIVTDEGVVAWDALILAGITIVLLITAVLWFRRRDIA
jgi:ABC-2 type transport system permease protein